MSQPELMQIGVRLVPWLTRAFGHQGAGWLRLTRLLALGATARDLLRDLVEEYPGFAEYAVAADGSLGCPYVCVALNSEALAAPAGLGLQLSDGDVVTLILPLAGD